MSLSVLQSETRSFDRLENIKKPTMFMQTEGRKDENLSGQHLHFTVTFVIAFTWL